MSTKSRTTRFLTHLLCFILVLAIAVPAGAGEIDPAPGRSAPSSPSWFDASAILDRFGAVGVQTQRDEALERLEWEIRMERARGRRATGRNLLIASGVGTVITLKAAGEGGDAGAIFAVNVLAAIAVVAVVGTMKFRGGGRDVRDLQREGRVRGYLSVGGGPDRVHASFVTSF